MNELIGRIVRELDANVNETVIGDPFLSPDSYQVFPISKERFHKISDPTSTRRMAFIDGGNQELIGAPNFSIQLNRIYFNIFEGTKRVIQEKIPHTLAFYSVTFSKFRESSIYYDTLLFPLREAWSDYLPSETNLSFNSMDRTVMLGTQRADIQRVASIARRFGEWNYAHFVAQEALEKADILVMDGTLQTAFKNEDFYFNQVHQSCLTKGIFLAGLAKTSALFTTTGLSLIGSIFKLASECELTTSAWGYYPIADSLSIEHGVRISVVKLNGNSNHIFRFEMSKKQIDNGNESETNEILSNLASNSRDPGFPGYPYGLVEADASARVTSEEAETQRILLLSEMSRRELWSKIMRHASASDAHDVLDFLKIGGSLI